MVDGLVGIVAPHHCCCCDKIGSLLCDNCKYNITSERVTRCIVCGRPTANNWLCSDCHTPYERAWAVGSRTGALQRLIGLYKFERAIAASKTLSALMLQSLPELPQETIIVPIPTVSSHIRERGYDHMLLIAKNIAQARGLKMQRLLKRQTSTKQRQATATQRSNQAKCAFAVDGLIDKGAIYLLVDDVMTTGSTMKYAARCLIKAGAKHVWIAIIARQTLD